jgi:hypothetical protein
LAISLIIFGLIDYPPSSAIYMAGNSNCDLFARTSYPCPDFDTTNSSAPHQPSRFGVLAARG